MATLCVRHSSPQHNPSPVHGESPSPSPGPPLPQGYPSILTLPFLPHCPALF